MTAAMQFGVALPHFSRVATREAVLRTAKAAEELGYESVWVTDHALIASVPSANSVS
jgi:alkanesulfonate monooxygenase SsuD/methylene tetrahydromethanopterin reductase-like flavin-dependent oxidoreductase (luciferase family)